MTDRRLTEIRVGILVLVSLAAIAGFVIVLADVNFGTMRHFYVDLESTGGVKKGATVRMIGVSLGKITDIRLVKPSKDSGRDVGVRLTAEIPEENFKLIPAGVTASVAVQSMLGEKHIELTPPPPSPDAPFKSLDDKAVITGRAPAGLEDLGGDATELVRKLSTFVSDNEESLSGAVTEIRGLAARANDFLDTNRPKLDETVENLRATSRALADGVSKNRIQRVLGKAETIVERFNKATVGIETELPVIVSKVGDLADHADTLVVDVNKLVDNVSEPTTTTIKDLQTVAADVKAGRGTVGKLLTNASIFDDFAAFAADIKAHPWKLLFKR